MLRALLLLLTLVAAPALAAPVTLTASDGVKISGEYEAPAGSSRGIILLFHMAGSNKSEYSGIAARFGKAGFSTLAIDQRSGGDAFGQRNATVAALGKSASFISALPDLEAALAYASGRSNHGPVLALGSSYSAALVFLLAEKHQGDLAAIMAFSPGEYLGTASVKAAAARLTLPVFVTSASESGEIAEAKAILAAARSSIKVQFVPKAGVHGASTLREGSNKAGATENWAAVENFLAQFK